MLPRAPHGVTSDRLLEDALLREALSLPEGNADALVARLSEAIDAASGVQQNLLAAGAGPLLGLQGFVALREQVRNNREACGATQGAKGADGPCAPSTMMKDGELRQLVSGLFGHEGNLREAALAAAKSRDACVFLVLEGEERDYRGCRDKLSGDFRRAQDWLLGESALD
jgi:hypothetical protein